jgi:hypothetical protein
MRCWLFALVSAAALAEPAPLVARLELAPKQQLTVDSVFEGAIRNAGFAVDSGKLAFMRHGKPVAATVGRSTLTPLVDLNFGGASAVMRFVF